MKKAYIAGPMRHIFEFNFPAFFAAENKLVADGWQVFNPARHDIERGFDPNGLTGEEELEGFSIRECMNADLNWITEQADAVFLLPGWEKSKGAYAEAAAAFSVGAKVFTLDGVPVTELGGIGSARSSEQVISESSTGGKKQVKLARFDLIPAGPLWTLAELYGKGQQKYPTPARNWELGYEWSKSFSALQRHAWLFWNREDIDPEMGTPHLASVAWHAFAMLEWSKTHPEMDDRPKV